MAEYHSIIIDTGSSSVKGGFSGNDFPISFFPNSSDVSHQTFSSRYVRPRYKDFPLIGTSNSSSSSSRLSDITNRDSTQIMDRGQVVHWGHLESIWHFLLEDELGVHPGEDDLPIYLVRNPVQSKEVCAQMAELLFERFSTPSLCFPSSPSLCLMAAGRTSGLSVDLGGGVTSITPVYQGFSLTHASLSLPYGGQDVTSIMYKEMSKRGFRVSFDEARQIKEQHAIASLKGDFDASTSSVKPSLFQLPDGSTIEVSPDVVSEVGEAFFKPKASSFFCTSSSTEIISSDQPFTIQEKIVDMVSMCELDMIPFLLSNIVLSGGSSSMSGIAARMKQEVDMESMKRETGRMKQFSTVLPHAQERGYSPSSFAPVASFVGCSILSSLSTASLLHVNKDEWEDEGVRSVLRKCF